MIKQKTLVAKNIDETLEFFENNMNATYSVAWINNTQTKDKIGQSLIILGEHASVEDLNKKDVQNPLKIKFKKNKGIPFYFPNWFLSKRLIKLFNSIFILLVKIPLKKNLFIGMIIFIH